jgi:alpha-L-fucosidase
MSKAAISFLCVATLLAPAQNIRLAPGNDDQRTRWFQDAKFGMFIHWGPYSVIGRHEWARQFYQIPQAEYDQYAKAFNPVKFNAAEWVDIAQNAGAKYMVITSKHHDGFSIYRSQVSDYDMEITPYAGDPLKDLARAAERRGMRFGFYHSIMDWHHPDYIPKRSWEKPNQKEGGNIDKYLDFMKGQLRELLTNYGPISTIWFDGEWEHSTQEMHSDEIYDFIRSIQPNTLINDRLYKRQPGNKADYGTPEQFVPATGMKDPSGKPVLWESCVTINTDGWGYNKYETDFKTSRDLIRMLIEVVSKGGNLLLNVGPKPDGTIQEEFVTRLAAMGEWMKVNGDSIYGTTASPFARLPFFGRATAKGNAVYLHVFQWPKDGKLRVPGLKNLVHSTKLLADPLAKIEYKREGDDIVLSVPPVAPHEAASVIELQLDGAPVVTPFRIQADDKGVYRLGAESSEIETEFEQRAKKENLLGHVYLTRWSRSKDVPYWVINVPKDGRYKVEITYGAGAAGEGTPYTIEAGGAIASGTVSRTANPLVFRNYLVGNIPLKAGDQTVKVRAQMRDGVAAMNLERVTLTRVDQ